MLTISPIEFPGLGLKLDPAVGFSIGSLNINFYGICIAVGLLLAVLYGCLRSKEFGFKQDDILDGVLIVVDVTHNSFKLEQRVVAQLQKADARILGVVLNRVDFKDKHGYYGKAYGYGYDYGYGEE